MIHLSSTLLLVGFLGGESFFELFDDVGVHVLVDLDGQEEDDEAGVVTSPVMTGMTPAMEKLSEAPSTYLN